MRWSLLFISEIIKALIKSCDLFSSFVGFLLSMDTIKRLIYDDPSACKRMTPEKIYFYFLFYPHFTLNILTVIKPTTGHVTQMIDT